MIGAKQMVQGNWIKLGLWNIEQFDPDGFNLDS
jgi:saccharopine dehydrogenase (NAD+, L-lysine-forming)